MAINKTLKPLKGLKVLSLSLNLPGPAALLRCAQMGARCVKIEPPSGDPMAAYKDSAFKVLHQGVRILQADLKTATGQKRLHKELESSDVLLTSFRPSALKKLGLSWANLHKRYPQLNMVSIVGGPGDAAEQPGHDLTYLAENDLVTGLDLPATLFADMGGALLSSEAVLAAVLYRQSKGKGVFQEIALSDAAAWLALPRAWGLTQASGAVGGAHAGYRIYPCKNGRVAVAALEPHFALSLCQVAGVPVQGAKTMFLPHTHQALAAWFLQQTRKTLDTLAVKHDIPMHTLPALGV